MTRPSDPTTDVPWGELVGDVAEHVQAIVRTEVRLAGTQLRSQAAGALRGALLLVGASALALLGVVMLLLAAVLALATVMAMWMAILIVAAGTCLLATALFLSAKRAR